jgi:hypothetical protein
LTFEEKELVHKVFKNEYIPYDVIGTGIDMPEKADGFRFKEKYKQEEYLL